MHVAVAVLGSVVMGMGVLVLDVLVFVRRVRVRVSRPTVLVFVRVRPFMRVFVVFLVRHVPHLFRGRVGSATACSPTSVRWCRGTPGPACSALKTASTTSCRTWLFSRL